MRSSRRGVQRQLSPGSPASASMSNRKDPPARKMPVTESVDETSGAVPSCSGMFLNPVRRANTSSDVPDNTVCS